MSAERTTCSSCNQDGYEKGYGCHFCDKDVHNNELVEVETQHGPAWLDKDDPSIRLYQMWSRGEIQTYVLEQELIQLGI